MLCKLQNDITTTITDLLLLWNVKVEIFRSLSLDYLQRCVLSGLNHPLLYTAKLSIHLLQFNYTVLEDLVDSS